jgi:hypothetical protein
MAGKRLAAAGAFAAVVAAAAVLWAAPLAPLASQPRAIRQMRAAVTTVTVPHVRLPAPPPTWQSVVRSPAAVATTGAALPMLALLGMALLPRRRTAAATATPPHHGRAPPSPVVSHRFTGTRGF